eukprot:Gb_32095 [translate_table: standard]
MPVGKHSNAIDAILTEILPCLWFKPWSFCILWHLNQIILSQIQRTRDFRGAEFDVLLNEKKCPQKNDDCFEALAKLLPFPFLKEVLGRIQALSAQIQTTINANVARAARSIWPRSGWEASCASSATSGDMVLWKNPLSVNMNLSLQDCNGRNNSMMVGYFHLIENLADKQGLLTFTWSNKRTRQAEVRERLDRASSDKNCLDNKNVPLKFNARHLQDKKFIKNLHNWWDELEIIHNE